MNRSLWTTVAHAFRRTALPLVSYYAITLAVPLANGVAQSGAFVGHAFVVLVVPPVAIVLVCAVHAIARAFARGCSDHATRCTRFRPPFFADRAPRPHPETGAHPARSWIDALCRSTSP